METINLGRTGLRVSRACLGTMTFGRQADQAEAERILDRAMDAGVTFIDTADAYPIPPDPTTNGETEEILGRLLAGRRDRVVLASKAFFPMGGTAHERGNSRAHIRRSVEASLRRLQTDRIELFQVHQIDRHTPIDETLGVLDDLIAEGKVLYAGVCNFGPAETSEALVSAANLPRGGLHCLQFRYNLLHRHAEHALLPMAERHGLGVIPYNPLAGGFLTAKHRSKAPNHEPPPGRFSLPGLSGETYRSRYWNELGFETSERIFALCDEAGLTPARVAVGWVLSRPGVTAPILGASRADQLDDVLPAFETPLEKDLVDALDEATRTTTLEWVA